MSETRTRFGERFARPRLALVIFAGVATGIAGMGLWVAATDSLAVLGFRAAVLGYVVALFGVSGYASMEVFERRDRRME